MIVEKYPVAMVLFHSLITTLLDKSEKILPSITPADLIDTQPRMKPLTFMIAVKNVSETIR